MEVHLGACALVIAFFCIFFGLTEVGLWVACYFECTDGKDVDFNYFAAIWTGALAFAIGFMIIVLVCVKFKALGTLIVGLTFILVPCEIICACLYAYRAYLARPPADEAGQEFVVIYFSVIIYSAMAVCGFVLFLFTIFWNCYYCCLATPFEDYEEEMKDEWEEEQMKGQNGVSAQDNRFVDNPIVEDDYRQDYPTTQYFEQTRHNRPVENGHVRFPDSTDKRRHTAMPQNNRYPDQRGAPDDRQARRPQSPPIRDDYPYPEAFNRESAPEHTNRRTPQDIQRMPIQDMAANDQSRNRYDNAQGRVNVGYEPDEFGRPRSNYPYSYLYDGTRGATYDRARENYDHYDPTYRPADYRQEDFRGFPNQHGSLPNGSAEYSRSNLDESRRHVNRPNRNGRQEVPAVSGGNSNYVDRRDDGRSHIYRPRPENFRGKPQKPEYMQYHQHLQRGAEVPEDVYLGGDTSRYGAYRGAPPANSYF
ncbi:uncharacterized protein [Diadema setosum]|uniref:uncharacterized protein n=1 Tax=Diadema setosum TaxID=31175 RepID=UPI003B3B6CAF